MRGGTCLRSSSVEHPPLKRVARVRIPPEVLTRVSSSGRTPVSQAGNTGSNPAARSTSFRDRPIGRTAGSDPANAGSNPAPGALQCNTSMQHFNATHSTVAQGKSGRLLSVRLGVRIPPVELHRDVAQPGRERVLGVHEAVGSNPAIPTPLSQWVVVVVFPGCGSIW